MKARSKPTLERVCAEERRAAKQRERTSQDGECPDEAGQHAAYQQLEDGGQRLHAGIGQITGFTETSNGQTV